MSISLEILHFIFCEVDIPSSQIIQPSSPLIKKATERKTMQGMFYLPGRHRDPLKKTGDGQSCKGLIEAQQFFSWYPDCLHGWVSTSNFPALLSGRSSGTCINLLQNGLMTRWWVCCEDTRPMNDKGPLSTMKIK